RCRQKRSTRPLHQQRKVVLERGDRSAWGPNHDSRVTAESDHLRRMTHLITTARQLLHALYVHPDLGGRALDRGHRAGQTHEAGIEPIEVAPDLLLLVAGGISGDEDQLDLISIGWYQSLQGERHVGKDSD